jgi:hypothetical protein
MDKIVKITEKLRQASIELKLPRFFILHCAYAIIGRTKVERRKEPKYQSVLVLRDLVPSCWEHASALPRFDIVQHFIFGFGATRNKF